MMKLCLALLVVLWLCTAVAVDRYVIASAHGAEHLGCGYQIDPIGAQFNALVHSDVKVVARPAAPPEWSERLIVAVDNLPWIGPLLSKILLYLGIVSSLLTTLVAAIHSLLSVFLGLANLFGRVKLASWLASARDGRVMYLLRFFSLFNAKKPVKVESIMV